MLAQFDFSGKKALVTGAAGVFGTWVCEAFVKAGAAVWGADIDADGLAKLTADLTALGGDARGSRVDLLREEDIARLREEVAAAWGAPDYVINVAGIFPNSLLVDIETEFWDHVMNLNVRGTFLMLKHFSKLMIARGAPGVFVNFISRSGFIPRMGAVHYAASKAAVEIMTRGYAMELARYGIRVCAVSPGFAPRDLLRPRDGAPKAEAYTEAMLKKIPLGRCSGPTDAPHAVLFLCSDSGAYITGSSILVEGGNSAGDFAIPLDER